MKKMIIFKIRGTVKVAETGIGIPGIFVKAYDKDLLFDDILGSSYTQKNGSFEIITEPENFSDFFEVKPDIYLKFYSPDGEKLIYSTKDSIRWDTGRLETFEVFIPKDSLEDLISEPEINLIDNNGKKRENFDVGESLVLQAQGIQPETVHDVSITDDNGNELFTNSLLSNSRGEIESTVIWPQFGLEDPKTWKIISFEEAQEKWKGRELKIELKSGNDILMANSFHIADDFSRPILLSTDKKGRVLNGFVAGENNAIVSGYNLPFEGQARVFMVPSQQDWCYGNEINPVILKSGRLASVATEIQDDGSFQARIARARELRPGAYDFIVRQLKYGYEDDEDLKLRRSDIVTKDFTGLVVREEYMASKFLRGGCPNIQSISGRIMYEPPYFQYTDTFQVGEDIYGALDPAALMPGKMGKMVALYVVKRPVANYQSLQHYPQTTIQQFKTQTSCINYNTRLLWPNVQEIGEYEIIADFGNDAPDPASFTPDASFDIANGDIIDGYIKAGFRIVPDPTTDTDPNIVAVGKWSYTETNYGQKTVVDDNGSFTVPLRAYVRFPADFQGATNPSQISVKQPNYSLIVAVHGNGHDYGNYDYLLDHWAKNGFIAASIHLAGSMGSLGRARILFEHLNILKTAFGAKAANDIGIMGHSRGGEAVVAAARLNKQDSLGHNINAIISLSPVDHYNNEKLGGQWATPYFVIYGAMDGDVAGGLDQSWKTGFALYDRATDAQKSMAFVYGATHDRFNLINPDVDIYSGWSELGSTDIPKLLSADTHKTIAKAYMTAFFRWHLKDEDQWEGIFKGEWMPAEVAKAEAGKVKIYTQYSDTTKTVIDDFEDAHTSTSWQVSTNGGSVDDSNTLPVDPVEDELFDIDIHSPHDTSGLILQWNDLGDKLEFKPPAPINVKSYHAVSFRVTQKVDSPENPVDQIQDFYLTLADTNNKSRAIKVSKFGEVPFPQNRYYNEYTKSAMCTIRIPLHVYEIEVLYKDRVDLQNIKSISFEFNIKTQGEIEIDSLEFTD